MYLALSFLLAGLQGVLLGYIFGGPGIIAATVLGFFIGYQGMALQQKYGR